MLLEAAYFLSFPKSAASDGRVLEDCLPFGFGFHDCGKEGTVDPGFINPPMNSGGVPLQK